MCKTWEEFMDEVILDLEHRRRSWKTVVDSGEGVTNSSLYQVEKF